MQNTKPLWKSSVPCVMSDYIYSRACVHCVGILLSFLRWDFHIVWWVQNSVVCWGLGLWSLLLCNVFILYLYLIGPNIFMNTLFSNTSDLHIFSEGKRSTWSCKFLNYITYFNTYILECGARAQLCTRHRKCKKTHW
jgi:hypothetical protein